MENIYLEQLKLHARCLELCIEDNDAQKSDIQQSLLRLGKARKNFEKSLELANKMILQEEANANKN